MFLLARCLPACGSGEVADGLDDVALGRVELTSGLADDETG